MSAENAPNTLTDEQMAAGWRLLFDGETTAGWRGYKQDACPDAWQAVDGALARVDKAGDIVTEETFADFELELEWKISPGGNSGIFFRVVEADDADHTFQTGPEMQIIDNENHPDGKRPITMVGSNYALHAPPENYERPVGEWNQVRLVANGAHVEQWLNGRKCVEYELWSDDWKARVADSKFAKWPGYGMAKEGHIAVQDHGDAVWFRNIRVRPL